MRDSNVPSIPQEKQALTGGGAAKCAANPVNFVDAVGAIMGLPLTDSEKAEAVRRLLAGSGEGS